MAVSRASNGSVACRRGRSNDVSIESPCLHSGHNHEITLNCLNKNRMKFPTQGWCAAKRDHSLQTMPVAKHARFALNNTSLNVSTGDCSILMLPNKLLNIITCDVSKPILFPPKQPRDLVLWSMNSGETGCRVNGLTNGRAPCKSSDPWFDLYYITRIHIHITPSLWWWIVDIQRSGKQITR